MQYLASWRKVMNKKGMVAAFLIVVAMIALIAHVSTTNLEFSRYNGDWAGTSRLFADLDAHGVRDLVSYADRTGRNDTLLLIIAPNTSFSSAEADALRGFLRGGNTVFVADETGVSKCARRDWEPNQNPAR
jgi:hypothetical protein